MLSKKVETKYDMLVNKNNRISREDINKIKLSKVKDINNNECLIEEETLKAFLLLKEELEKKGIIIGVISAYRSFDDQEKITNDYLKYLSKEEVKMLVAPIGASEHHTGLAVDISIMINGEFIPDNVNELYEIEDIYEKIHAILSNFGFILRYPKGKEEITSYCYEPWHIRYVGKQVADEIYKEKIVLEEHHKLIKRIN